MPSQLIMGSTASGVITNVSHRIAGQDSVAHALNFVFDEELGYAKTRLGLTELGGDRLVAEDNDVLGLYNFIDSAGTYPRLIAAVNEPGDGSASLYYLDSSSKTQSKTGLTAGAKVRFETFLDSVVAVNGNEVMSWTGTGDWITGGGAFDLDNMPIGTLVSVYKDQVVVSGVDDDDTLHISSTPLGGAISWISGNRTITVNPEDGQKIMGHGEISGLLIVLKRHAMYTWNNRATEPDEKCSVGCSSHESIATGGDMMFFFNEDGIWATRGSYPVRISRKVQKWIDGMSASFYGSVNGYCSGRYYYCSIGDCTVDGIDYTNIVLRYTLDTKEWAVYSYANSFRVMTRWNDSGTIKIVGGDSTSRILQLEAGDDDDGTPISYELETHDIDFGAMSIETILGEDCYGFCENPNGELVQLKMTDGDWEDIGSLDNAISEMKNPPVRGGYMRFRVTGSRSIGRLVFKGLEFPEVEGVSKTYGE